MGMVLWEELAVSKDIGERWKGGRKLTPDGMPGGRILNGIGTAEGEPSLPREGTKHNSVHISR
jgi:hypothetical protein